MNTDQETINEICSYVEANEIKPMLQEYLKRVILEQPAEPIKFLMKTIAEEPYVLTSLRREEKEEEEEA